MTLHPVYLLTGSDNFTKKEYEKKLISEIFKSFGNSGVVSLYPSECTPEDIINEILSGSLFNSHKIVSVKQAEKPLEEKDSDFKQFVLNYCTREDYPATLILKTDNNKIKGLNKLPGKNFKPPYEDKMPRWIISRAKEKNREITYEAATLIAFRCGRNLRAASTEIEKVFLSFPELQKIGVEEVKSVAGIYKKGDIFGYLNALVDSDKQKALKILKNLIDFGSQPVRIVAMIKWKLQQMIQVKILMNRGMSEKQIIKDLNLRPAFLYRGMSKKLKNFSLDKLIESYENLKQTDIKLKSTSVEEKLLLEKFTLELLSG